MLSLATRIERFPLAHTFTSARGTESEAIVVVAEVADGSHRGRGECNPRFGNGPEAVTSAIMAMAGAQDGVSMTPVGARFAALLGVILTLAPTQLTEVLGVPVKTQSTQGPDQNIVLLEAGQVKLGMVTMGPALQGWNGTGEWTKGKKYRAQRALFPMYDTPFHLVVGRDSGIRSVADMAGKRIGVGPRGGTAGTYYPAVFKVLNVSPAVRSGAWDEIGTQLQNNQLDILGYALGVPFPVLVKLEKEMQLESVAFTADEIATLRKAMPELSTSVIPAGTYASLKADYQTVGMYNFAVAHKDLPDDLVYAIVKAVFGNHDRLVAIHSSAKETLAANVSRNGFLPFHPGAVRYYREIGVALPDTLVSP